VRAVNLLPRDEAPKSFEKNRGVAFGAAGGLALVTVGLCAMLLTTGGAIKDRRVTLESLRAELAALPSSTNNVDPGEEASLGAEKSARTSALSTALADRVAWDSVLRQISQVLPQDVWLASLTTTAPIAEPGTVAEPAGVELVGSTYSQSGVARFLARLAVVPSLTNVTLQSSFSVTTGSQPLVQFSIRAHVKTPGASA
jgi:Tfp pilus assembly protein PilN